MTPEETYYWQNLAKEARSKSLDHLHASAENWAKALTALVGALALIGVALSPTALNNRSWMVAGEDLADWAPVLLTLIFVGLLLTTWFAFRASRPKEQAVSYDAAGYRDYYIGASKDAYWNLTWFRRTLLLSALPFIAYALISIYATPASKTSKLFEINTDQGLYCGTITEDTTDGQLVIKTQGGKDIKTAPPPTTPPEDRSAPENVILKSLTPVKACDERPLPNS